MRLLSTQPNCDGTGRAKRTIRNTEAKSRRTTEKANHHGPGSLKPALRALFFCGLWSAVNILMVLHVQVCREGNNESRYFSV